MVGNRTTEGTLGATSNSGVKPALKGRRTVGLWKSPCAALLLVALLTGGPAGLAASVTEAPWASDLVREVEDALYRLDFARAEQLAKQGIETEPANPVGYGLLALVRWNIMLNAAANPATDDYATPTPFTKGKTYKPIERESQAFEQANHKLLEMTTALLEEDPANATALYFQGVAYENWAAESLAIRKNQGSVLTLGRKTVQIHERVLKLNPDFTDANLSIGCREFACATLPWGLKFFSFLFGCLGANREKALDRLELVAEQGRYRHLDAQVMIALLNAWKGDPQVAVRVFSRLSERYPENYLLDINWASICENGLGDRKTALKIYQNLLRDLDQKAPGLKRGEVLYRIGRTYYGLREYSQALDAFRQVWSAPAEEKETVPLSHYYSGLIHEEQGDAEAARRDFAEVLKYQGPPEVLKDELKQARKRLQ